MSKHEQLRALAEKRKRSRWDGYKGIGDYHDGVYECDFVSPYTKSAANVDSEIVVVLQDWSSDAMLSGPVDYDAVTYGRTRQLPTNRNLVRLLKTHFNVSLSDIYATNLFPFIKMGSMSQAIPQRDMIRAAREYTLPQIRIVQPTLTICLGLNAFNAISAACGHNRQPNVSSAIESPFTFEGTRIWCQAHTGALGQNNRNRGGTDRVSSDWERMRQEATSVS